MSEHLANINFDAASAEHVNVIEGLPPNVKGQ